MWGPGQCIIIKTRIFNVRKISVYEKNQLKPSIYTQYAILLLSDLKQNLKNRFQSFN